MSKNKVVCRNLAATGVPQVSDLGIFGPSAMSKQNADDIKRLKNEIASIKAELQSIQQQEDTERVEEEGEKMELEQLSTDVNSLKTRCDAYHEMLERLSKSTAAAMTAIESLEQKNNEAHIHMQSDINKVKDDHFKMDTKIQRNAENILELSSHINELAKQANESFHLVKKDVQGIGQDLGMIFHAMAQHGLLPPPQQQPQLMPPPGQHPQLMPPEYLPDMMYVKNFSNGDSKQNSKITYKIDLKPFKLKK